MNRYRLPAIVSGLSGCLLLPAAPFGASTGLAMIPAAGNSYYYGMPAGLAPLVIGPPLAAIVLSLLMLRWWPYQLLVAALLSGPQLLIEFGVLPRGLGVLVFLTGPITHAFALIGVLACAQALWRGGAHRWGATMAGLALGFRLLGTALIGSGRHVGAAYVVVLCGGLVVATFGLLAFAWRVQWADRENADPRAGGAQWPRIRSAVVTGLALFTIIPLSQVSRKDAAGLLGLDPGELAGQRYILAALAGVAGLVLALGITAAAGLWSFGGALTMTLAQTAPAAPLLVIYFALAENSTARWLGALAGVALGLAVTASRRPPAVAGALCVAAALSLFVADATTGGAGHLIGTQHRTVPAVILLVLVVAAVTAVAVAVTPVLAERRSLPAVHGPLAGLMASGLVQALEATYLEADGQPANDTLNAAEHLPTTGLVLLVTAAAVGGLGVARHLSERWAQRKHAEQIRHEAAEAERVRLARPIHDGVLHILSLVQRQESDARLAELAGQEDAALRRLLRDET
ncbi:hypothetical protein [Actinoplanes sp. NPDC020271]|uniref:hypothetical protein n=1 Tax=Actinoplanes sp. NPDC020271 TaxID=3363896 RepID=UPI0037B91349